MSSVGVQSFYKNSLASAEEDLVRKILLTHDPDGSQLDSQLLLRTAKNIIHCANPLSGADSDPEIVAINIWDVEAVGLRDSLGYTIFKISHEVLSRCFEEGDPHTKTMLLLDMLGSFKWDAKVILVLAAFLKIYGEFQLRVQLQSHHTMAALVALLKQLPHELKGFGKQFKALILLVNTMMELTEVIIDFENLPLQLELLEFKALSVIKPKIYMAIYWIFRSTLACFSLITGLMTTKQDQVNSRSTTIAAWTMFSLVYRLNGLCPDLRKQVETCHQQIGTELYKKLLNLSRQTGADNQEMLKMLIPFVDNFPLKDCLSEEKHGISELKNKVVILLVSKPELLPIEKIFLLVQQTINHPHLGKVGWSYVILWFPLSSSHTWSQTEKTIFLFLANSLPFWSLRQPWFLNSAVVSFIKQEWSFKDETMLVVLDTNGMVTNSNAIDMIWIWGVHGFPYSVSREKELWEVEEWTLKLLTDGVDPLLTKWVEEGKDICIYSSDNLDWIREFTAKTKEIKSSGLQLEVIYVGWKSQGENLLNILDVIEQDKLSYFLTYRQACFFWLRLESMKSSITRQGQAAFSDVFLKEILELLEVDKKDDGWVLIGKGSLPGLVKLQGMKATGCFDLLLSWADKVGNLGLVDAIKSSLERPMAAVPCNHYDILPYSGGLTQGTVFCSVCKRPMEKFLLYKCEAND